MFESILIGVTANLVYESGQLITGKLNLPYLTPTALGEIEKAQVEALNKWSKNEGAKDRNFWKVRQLVKDNYEKIIDEEEIPEELKDYLEIFKTIISTDKYQNAYRYLTYKQYDKYFKVVLEKIKEINSDILTKTKFDERTSEIISNQQHILTEIKKLHSNYDIKYKKDAYLNQDYFIGSSLNTNSIVINRQLKSDNHDSLRENSLNELLLNKNLSSIIIKGLPGSGKSFELQKLANDLWEDDSCDLIPFYRNLRHFTTTHTFESFFDLEHINQYLNVVFILDGLDEIKDEADFLGKLNTFIQNRKNLSHRIVISCRSNILEKHKNELQDFDTYVLQNLTTEQSRYLLKHKTNIDFNIPTLEDFKEKSSFFNDPYKVNLVAEYYNEEKKLETNPAILWDVYYKSILKIDKEKLRKKQLLQHDIKRDSQTIAFILESTKEMNISEGEIYSILERKERRLQAFINSAIILCEDENYAFEHKQLQEYLAGLLIASLSYDQIVNIFKINEIDSIRPSLLNTFSLLLYILENDPKYKKLLNWISDTEPEVLFNADLDRIFGFRVKVFQSFFRRKCIETSIWINNYTGVSAEQIGRFADCEENFCFLMEILEDKTTHFRVQTSALEVLANFKHRRDRATKDRLFKLLANFPEKGYENVNGSILQLFINWDYQQYFHSLIEDVIEFFDGDDHTSHTTKILNLILKNKDDIEAYQNFISKEFEYEFNAKGRKNDDNVGRGNAWRLELIILSTEDVRLFLHYFDKLLKSSYQNNNYYTNDFLRKCVERIKDINKSDDGEKEIIKLFFKILKSRIKRYYVYYDFLFGLVKELNINKEIFKKLFKPKYIEESFHACARLLVNDRSCMNIFKERINDLTGLDENLEYFRNVLNSYNKREIAIEVEDYLLGNGFKLKEEIKNRITIEDLKERYTKKLEHETKVVFDKSKLQSNLESYFEKLSNNQINCEELFDDYRKSNDVNSLFFTFGYKKLEERFISEIFRSEQHKEAGLDDCKAKLDNQLFYANFVFNEIESLKNNRHVKFNLKRFQPELQILIDNTIENIKTENLFSYLKDGRFSITSNINLNSIENIHNICLNEEFEIKVNDDFILNTLQYFDFKNDDIGLTGFENYLSLLDNMDKLEETVISNLEGKLVSTVFGKHALYALKHEIKDSYGSIKENLLKDDNIFRYDDILVEYVKANGVDILFEIANKDIHNRSSWTAIMMLLKYYLENEDYPVNKTNFEPYINKSLDYLKSENTEFSEYASNVLFSTNRSEIINYILDDLEHRLELVFYNNLINFSNYSALPDMGIPALEKMFHEIFKTREKINSNISYLNTFYKGYITNLVKENNFKDINCLFLKIKDEVEKSNDDNKIFHINVLLRDIENVYVNMLSNGLEKEEAIKIIRELDI